MLVEINGTFVQTYDQIGYVYSKRQELRNAVLAAGQKNKLPEITPTELPESMLAELVDCIDDVSLSSSVISFEDRPPPPAVYRDSPAPLGWVCHAALTAFVSHTMTNEDEITRQIGRPHWIGYLHLPSSPTDMQAAKLAWQKVLAEKTYFYHW